MQGLMDFLSPQKEVNIPYRRGEKPKKKTKIETPVAPQIVESKEQPEVSPEVPTDVEMTLKQSVPQPMPNELIEMLKTRQQEQDRNMLLAGASGALGEFLFGGAGQIAGAGAQMAGQFMKRKQALEDQEMKNLMATSLATLKKKGEKEKDRFKDIMSLRRHRAGLPTTRDTQTLTTSFKKIREVYESAPTAAGDISLIFNYMKMLDPSSVVREGEQATAAQARGVPQAIISLYNRLISGEKLEKTQRADFANRAMDIYRTQAESQASIDAQFRQMAEEAGFDSPTFVNFSQKGLLDPMKTPVVEQNGWEYEYDRASKKYIPKRKLD